MAENTITALIPDIYEAADVVSRELTGMIPAVTMSASAERAALNQSIVVDVEPAGAAVDITPAMTVPEPAAQTSAGTTIAITKSKAVPFSFIGDHQKALNTGIGYGNVRVNKIAQAFRTMANLVETDLAALHTTTSRAYGTAGTTPLATAGDFTDATRALKILKDNGSPVSDNQLVVDTSAGANFLGKQARVDIQGDASMLRSGVFASTTGLDIRESGQIVTSTAGTAASATTDATGYAVGSTDIALASAGTGTLVAGDVVTFAGDTNKYVLVSGDADVSDGGSIVLAAPGLRKAISTSATAITVIAAAARNMIFNRSAIVLAARMPAMPEEGDIADDVFEFTDPVSGITFEFAMYKGFRKVRYQIGLAWGVKNIKPEHTGLLLG